MILLLNRKGDKTSITEETIIAAAKRECRGNETLE